MRAEIKSNAATISSFLCGEFPLNPREFIAQFDQISLLYFLPPPAFVPARPRLFYSVSLIPILLLYSIISATMVHWDHDANKRVSFTPA